MVNAYTNILNKSYFYGLSCFFAYITRFFETKLDSRTNIKYFISQLLRVFSYAVVAITPSSFMLSRTVVFAVPIRVKSQ